MKISIVMPSYQQEKYLPAAIDSVLSQEADGFDIELIVADGGSSDNSRKILESYGPRIRWTSERDEGQSDALNKALRQSTGDIIGWLNSDDLYMPGCLKTVAAVFAAEPDTKWLYGKANIVDAGGSEIRRWITAYKNFKMRRFSFAHLLRENWISQMGVFWRRDALQEVGEFRKDLHYCMDYDYWLRLGKRWPGRFVDSYLASFRWYPQSKSGANYRVQFAEQAALAAFHSDGKYPVSIFMQRLNAWKIVMAYRIMDTCRNISTKGKA